MAERYLVDEQVCELTDVKFKFSNSVATGIELTFHKCIRIKGMYQITDETITKCWNFPLSYTVDSSSGTVPLINKLQAIAQLEIESYWL